MEGGFFFFRTGHKAQLTGINQNTDVPYVYPRRTPTASTVPRWEENVRGNQNKLQNSAQRSLGGKYYRLDGFAS